MSRFVAGSASALLAVTTCLASCSPPPPPPAERAAVPTPTPPLDVPQFDDVVLVTLDTLRADHLGSYGYPRRTSPFIDSLARDGVRFTQAVAASSHTAPSHASLFTGLYPEQHRVLVNGVRLSPGIPSIAGLLSAGRETAGFASVGFLHGLSAGFEAWDADVPAGRQPPYRYADETIAAALRWLEGRDRERRFLLWIHLYDAHEHGPRATTSEDHLRAMNSASGRYERELLTFLQTRHGFPGPEWDGSFDRYDAQIAFMDAQLERLHAAIAAHNPDRRTLWVITSDHGEGMGSHDYWGHGMRLYDEQLRVPLILHASDGSLSPARVGKLVRLVDLLPTLLDLTGAALPVGAKLEGRSLIPLMLGTGAWETEPAFAQRRPADERRRRDGWSEGLVLAGQDGRYKYILDAEGGDELYDLMADPLELNNLLEERPETAARLREWLATKYEALAADPRAETDLTIDADHVEALRALGYL